MTPIVSATLYARLCRQAGPRCGYCRTSSQIIGQPLTVEHIIPVLVVAHPVKTISGFRAGAATSSRALKSKPQIPKPVSLFRCSIPDDSPGATTLLGLVTVC